MTDKVFCIDLGSAYTKVALRCEPSADSQLIEPLRAAGPAPFCVPTVVSIETGPDAQPRYEFGVKAADGPSSNHIIVHRNWKKSLFLDPPAEGTQHSQLEALLASREMADLAIRFAVPPTRIEHLRQMVAAARGVIAEPAKSLSPESNEYMTAVDIAEHYFVWLRQEVLVACKKLPTSAGLGDCEAIPVRISVPAFVFGRGIETHPGCLALIEALRKAGWPLHPENALVTEPYSNAIGILTKGKNHITPNGVTRLYTMITGPFLRTITGDKHFQTYRALIIDIGAFTTDFASVDVNNKGVQILDAHSAVHIAQHSVPVGISNLDSDVAKVLPPEKAAWLKNARSYEYEAFRQTVYSEGKPHTVALAGKRLTFGMASEGKAIREAIQTFCFQLAGAVAEFCEGRKPASKQELILTGGGSAIPAVRDTLVQAAQKGGHSFDIIHAASAKKVAGGAYIAELDTELIRGGSALGGTSLYFG